MASHASPRRSVSPPASKRPRTAEEEDHPGSSASIAAAAAPAPSPAGFIFMCSSATKPECYRHLVLGLPRGKLDAVSRIRRGAALFLFDFDIKQLHGPYRADSDGGLNLVPAAFNGRFPAQVKFKIEGDFIPIHESSLRSAIKENYFKGKFSQELNSAQVDKLRVLFEPIGSHPESAPSLDVDGRFPAPAAYLPPPAAQPTAYAHHPTACVRPRYAHPVPPESYAPPCSYVAAPIAQPTAHAYYVTTTGNGYQPGYNTYGPLPSTYQYVQVRRSCSQYVQYSMSENVLAPVSSTAPYYAPYQNAPNVTCQHQQNTYDRAACGAGQNIVATNLQLVRHYGLTPPHETKGTTRISKVGEYQPTVTYTTHGASSMDNSYAAPATSNTGASIATSKVISSIVTLPPQSVYVAAAAPAYH